MTHPDDISAEEQHHWELMAELKELDEKLAAESARLDWLVANTRAMVVKAYDADREIPEVWVVRYRSEAQQFVPTGYTPREAIDAAMGEVGMKSANNQLRDAANE